MRIHGPCLVHGIWEWISLVRCKALSKLSDSEIGWGGEMSNLEYCLCTQRSRTASAGWHRILTLLDCAPSIKITGVLDPLL